MRRYFFRRRLRDTQPKKRVPRTRFLRFMSRTLFAEKRLELPSRNCVCFDVRVISAR